jgi:hypothetical protein
MELSTILELCETNMSEGDYLEAAKLLKNLHKEIKKEDTDFEYTRSIETCYRIFKVNRSGGAVGDPEDELRLYMKYIVQEGLRHQDRYKFYSYNKTEIVKKDDLFKFLRRHFTLNLYNHIEIANGDETIHEFNFQEFSNFHIERLKCIDEDYYENHAECDDVKELYDEFIEYSVNMIEEFLEEIN